MHGWAIDPDDPNREIDIAVYANDTLIVQGRTNTYRDDVNRMYGITGNHGFEYFMPESYNQGYRYAIKVFAVDAAINNTGYVNTRLGTRVFSLADQVVYGQYTNGSPIRLQTSERLAGAIGSLTWGGKEFINSADHGRELQSAVNNDPVPERYNPTEAGSEADGSGPYTTSNLIRIKTVGSNLKSETQMAFWKPFQGRLRSDQVLFKDVNVGFQELANVIRYNVTFDVPENDRPYGQFETLTAYMPSEFSKFYEYYPNTRAVVPLGGCRQLAARAALAAYLLDCQWQPRDGCHYGEERYCQHWADRLRAIHLPGPPRAAGEVEQRIPQIRCHHGLLRIHELRRCRRPQHRS